MSRRLSPQMPTESLLGARRHCSGHSGYCSRQSPSPLPSVETDKKESTSELCEEVMDYGTKEKIGQDKRVRWPGRAWAGEGIRWRVRGVLPEQGRPRPRLEGREGESAK